MRRELRADAELRVSSTGRRELLVSVGDGRAGVRPRAGFNAPTETSPVSFAAN